MWMDHQKTKLRGLSPLANYTGWMDRNFTYVISKKKKVVGLERGPLSLVSTTEELLDRKVAAPV
jgi:hypothetical protein